MTFFKIILVDMQSSRVGIKIKKHNSKEGQEIKGVPHNKASHSVFIRVQDFYF